nr:hypothetical protein [Tanacetum cinerariifolium]
MDACKYAKEMYKRIKRLMYGFEVTSHVRHLQLMDEFDKFAAKEGESLESVYERLTTLMNIVDRELHEDSQEDKLTTAMMLLARAITQKFSTPTNNHLRTSSNTRNQAVIQDGRVDIQTKNAAYGGNGNKNAGRQNMNQAFNAGNVNDESQYACDCQKRIVRDAKYFREQMFLAIKDKDGSNLNAEENDFMLNNSFGDETLEDLTAVVIMIVRIQSTDGNTITEPNYDAQAVSEVNASHKAHEQMNHVKSKTIIDTSDDDQIDSNIIFNDSYVENNSGTSEHESNDHDKYHNIQLLAYNVQREAKIKND